ncbi:MAG TPA: RecX family transcriptional regulator [Candidatus Saccharimonadales bacterium]|nr:RecX family transcriptional regulator [Candidatus Saccharimonadales bacterium]
MPKVTKIAQQVKRQHRYSIFVDGKFNFSLSELEITGSGLRVGTEVSDEDMILWQRRSDAGKAIEKAYNFLSYRARSRREIEDYLRRKKYEPETAEQVIKQLENEGLINDAQFATNWSQDRQTYQLRSRRQLQAELIKKGVDREAIEQSMTSLADEVETITQLVNTRNLLNKYDDERKLMAYLAGKGFSYGDIKTALRRFSD